MANLQTYRVHIVCRSDYEDTHPRTSYYFDYQAADMKFHLQDIVHMDVTDLYPNWSASHP